MYKINHFLFIVFVDFSCFIHQTRFIKFFNFIYQIKNPNEKLLSYPSSKMLFLYWFWGKNL